jgi:hypothetical protein
VNHHTIAAVSIIGTCLDVLGSLYLAYDLLGGQHGPLRLLTRAVTYSIFFGIGYGLGLGLFFGVAAGLATGITLSIEFNRAARGLGHYSLPWEAFFSAIRAFGFGAALYRTLGLEFAIAFGTVITIGQVFGYSRGMRPAMDYTASRRPALRVASFGALSSAPSATSAPRLPAALSCIMWNMPGPSPSVLAWSPASSPASWAPCLPTSSITPTTFPSAASVPSASDSCSAASLFNPSNTGSRYLMCA